MSGDGTPSDDWTARKAAQYIDGLIERASSVGAAQQDEVIRAISARSRTVRALHRTVILIPWVSTVSFAGLLFGIADLRATSGSSDSVIGVGFGGAGLLSLVFAVSHVAVQRFERLVIGLFLTLQKGLSFDEVDGEPQDQDPKRTDES